MSHSNISVFVPHIGCKCRCSFCNQNSISGEKNAPTVMDVESAVLTATSAKNYNPKKTELAFFGGSFTAIDRDYMLSLLEVGYKYVKSGVICGIRISTRPDAISREILELLKSFGVTAIELGAQSMSDEVLKLNKRGHLSDDVAKASHLIKSYHFELGLQMMTGLYGSTVELDKYTAEQLILLKPNTVRIYPTIVLKNTELEKRYLKGEYPVFSLETTVELCAELLELFNNNGIKVIRLGLHTINEQDFVAGPWHPALGELVESEIYYKKVKSLLKNKGNYLLNVSKNSVSKMIGQKRKNILRLKQEGFNCIVKGKDEIEEFEVYLQEM